MTARAPQPLADIDERIELLKTTLGLFPPGEPAPIARELYELGEDILLHWLLARGFMPPADLTLLGLADEVAHVDGTLEAAADACREISRLEEAIVRTPDDPETGAHLVALAAAAGQLYALVAPRVAPPKSPGATAPSPDGGPPA
jgi:enoyl-CoA hydratase/carnithine racemase